MDNQDKKYSTLKFIATIYKILPFVIVLALLVVLIILGMKIAEFKTFLLIDVGLILFVIVVGITMFAIAELIKLFISNEQGIIKTNELLTKLLE